MNKKEKMDHYAKLKLEKSLKMLLRADLINEDTAEILMLLFEELNMKEKSTKNKRCTSLYNYYVKINFKKVKEENPNLKSSEIIRHLAKQWKSESDRYKNDLKEEACDLGIVITK